MIILLVLLMVAAIALFIIKAKNLSAYWMASVLLGWFLSMSGLVLFISKFGGFYYKVNLILFFNDYIRNLLLSSPISIDTISRMITLGRSLFVFSLIGLSVSLFYNKSIKKTWYIYAVSAILPVLHALFYDPVIYRWSITVFDRQQTYVISIITRAWVVISAVGVLAVMVWCCKRAPVPWIKSQLKLILLGIFALIMFYFYLGFMGPLQVSDVRTYYFLYSDFSNFNPPLTTTEWYLGIFATGITNLISVISIWKYTDIEKQLGRSELKLERKLRTAKMGVRVFTHGIKNQLIMSQVLVNNTSELIASKDPGNDEKALENLHKISDVLNQTLNRLDQLYSSFKFAHLELKPVYVSEVMQNIINKLKVIPDNIELKCNMLHNDVMVLADQFHLTDATYNILVNAFEAIGTERSGIVTINADVQYKWIVIKVEDNGPGIPTEHLGNIFDPFFTSKNTAKNWGVGLSYSKQVVNSHFGYIHVESTPGIGSSFSIFLPVYTLNR